MKAVEISAQGEPDVLSVVQRPIPRPQKGEVLIQVVAAGVNYADVMQRKGYYPPPPGASDIPGLEVAGVITAVGAGVRQWQPGDAVCAILTGGGYAEYCLASESLCLPLPDGLDFFQAAAVPETFFAVWMNVFGLGRLREKETILVHGGAGGIGTTAIQLAATLRRAKILTTCGSEEKGRFCEDLGAAKAINYRNEDFAERVTQLTDGKGVDLILDIIGAPYLQPNLKALAPAGRLIIIAVQGGYRSEVNLLPVLLKRLTVSGSTLRSRPVKEKAKLARQLRNQVWPLLESGKVKPIIHTFLPLSSASEAHRILEHSDHIGKIVLIP